MSEVTSAIPWHLYAIMVMFSVTIGLLVALELGRPSSRSYPHRTRMFEP